jgi:hypothetical protein
VKRNRFIALDGATKSVNRELEAKARDLAGLKGYVTNLAACPDGTPPWPSPGSSSTAPDGPSGSSSAPPDATAPCRSAQASTSSPPKTRSHLAIP